MLPQGKGHVLGHGHAVEQGRLLEEEAEADSLLGQLPLARGRPGPARRSRPLPRVGRSSPMIVFNSTVLPQPLSPIIATVSPRAIARSMSRSTLLPAEIDAQCSTRSSALGGTATRIGV